MVKWVSKFYEQDMNRMPIVTDVAVFDTKEEAMNHFHNSRYTNTTYYYWSYPEKVSDEEAERLLKQYKGDKSKMPV